MIYLASPFTATPEELEVDPDLQRKRYEAALHVTGELLVKGRPVFSPIVHCYCVAISHGLPSDYAFWARYDRHMLGRSDELYVLMIDGWDRSRGVSDEIEWAIGLGKPVRYVDDRGEVVQA